MKGRLSLVFAVSLFILQACAPQPRPAPPPPDQRAVRPREIPVRIDTQQRRINQGIDSGELRIREADVLQDNLNWIRSGYNRARVEGRLTPREIRRLEMLLDRNSEMIDDRTHNPVRLY